MSFSSLNLYLVVWALFPTAMFVLADVNYNVNETIIDSFFPTNFQERKTIEQLVKDNSGPLRISTQGGLPTANSFPTVYLVERLYIGSGDCLARSVPAYVYGFGIGICYETGSNPAYVIYDVPLAPTNEIQVAANFFFDAACTQWTGGVSYKNYNSVCQSIAAGAASTIFSLQTGFSTPQSTGFTKAWYATPGCAATNPWQFSWVPLSTRKSPCYRFQGTSYRTICDDVLFCMWIFIYSYGINLDVLDVFLTVAAVISGAAAYGFSVTSYKGSYSCLGAAFATYAKLRRCELDNTEDDSVFHNPNAQMGGAYYLYSSCNTTGQALHAPTAAPVVVPPSATAAPQIAAGCFAGTESVLVETGEAKLMSQIVVGDRILASADVLGSVMRFSPVVAVPHSHNNLRAEFIDITTAAGHSIRLTPDHLIVSGDCIEKPSCGRQDSRFGASMKVDSYSSADVMTNCSQGPRINTDGASGYRLIPAGQMRVGSCIRVVESSSRLSSFYSSSTTTAAATSPSSIVPSASLRDLQDSLAVKLNLFTQEDEVVSVSTVESVGLYTVVTEEPFVVVNGIVASPFSDNHAAAHAFYNIHRAVFRLLPSLLSVGVIRRAVALFGNIVVSISSFS